MEEKGTENWVKKKVMVYCFAFFCNSVHASLHGIVPPFVSNFQPYTQGPFHLVEEPLTQAGFELGSALAVCIHCYAAAIHLLVYTTICFQPNNAHSPLHQNVHYIFRA